MMKGLSVIALFVAALSTCRAYEQRVLHVVEQLRDMEEVGSDSVGYAGAPHGFYLLYRYCWYASTDEDLIEMLRDRSPVVRLMGAKCIVTAPYRHIDQAVLRPLRGDLTAIKVGPGGCVFRMMTVGDVVGELIRDPDFLGPREPRRRDAGTTRIPSAVTPPPFSQVPRFTFLENARVVLLGDLTSDAKSVYVTAREVWRGPIQAGQLIRIPKAPNAPAGEQTQPSVVVFSIANYPSLKTWSAQGTDGVRIGGLDHPTVQELREYFSNQPDRSPDPTPAGTAHP